MSNHVISSSVSNGSGDGWDLTGNGDTLLVTSSGSVVQTDGGFGVYASGGNEAITLDGLIYAAYTNSGSVSGDAVYMTGSGDTLTVDAFVQGGGSGVQIGGAGTGDFVDVGSLGTIQGIGPASFGFGILGQNASTSDSLDNAGTISAVTAVGISDGGGDTIVNSGDISGTWGVNYQQNVAAENIENSGTIAGGGGSNSYAIGSLSSTAGIDVVNSGLLVNGGKAAVLYFDDAAGTELTIDNTGTITGNFNVIESQSDILYINNSGTIHGLLYSVARVYIDNSGLWQASAGNGHTSVFAAAGSLINAHAGTIDGDVDFSGAGDVVHNAGKIEGAVALVAGDDAFTNSGAVDEGVAFTGTGPTNAFTNAHAGTITGAVTFGGSGDTIDNAGKIDGAVSLVAGSDTFTNAGDIDGAVTFTGTGAKNTLTNSGTITGNVTLAGATSTLTSHGQIYGNVGLAASDTLTNTGTIHGDVTLGAKDTIDDSRGEITGSITAANSDSFDYKGLFGEETINKFVVGSGSTHDTIQFAANDFGTFTAVQSAMTQVGSDTLIRLDAADSITLVGVTMTNLVAADFRFV